MLHTGLDSLPNEGYYNKENGINFTRLFLEMGCLSYKIEHGGPMLARVYMNDWWPQ